MFKHVAKRTEKRDTVRKPKDRRNGRFSGVVCPCLNPSPSFLLLFCGKKVEETVTMSWFAPLARKLKHKTLITRFAPPSEHLLCTP